MKNDGKKDGDRMKITKARLVEIIKEELENLEEKSLRDRLSGYFGGRGSAEKYEQTPEQARDELETRAGELGSAVDKLSKKDRMVANAAVADATADAADMDSKLEDELEDEMIARDEMIKNNVVRPVKFDLINLKAMLDSDEFINKIVSALRARNEKAHSEETGE